MLQTQVVGRQLLFGFLGGQGHLLLVQLNHVAPQRTGLGGGGFSTLSIEVVVVLKYGMLSFYQRLFIL